MANGHINVLTLLLLEQLLHPAGDRHARLTTRFIRNFDLLPSDPPAPAATQGLEDGLFDGESAGEMEIGIAEAKTVLLLPWREHTVEKALAPSRDRRFQPCPFDDVGPDADEK